MPVVEESVFINRSASEVFDFVIRPENQPKWDSSMLECELVDDAPVAVGSKYRGATKVMGRRFDWTTEVIEFEPGVRSASRAIEGVLKFTVSTTLAAVDGGTRLTYRIEAESGLGGSFGKVMEPIVQKAQAKVVRSNLDSLANLLSATAA
jgi:carbon monoxide dehydrogenase subunit G